MEQNYHDLNAQINLWDENGDLQLDKDKDAAHAYFLQHVNQATVFFHSLEEKADHLINEGLWDEDVVYRFGFDTLKSLMKHAYSFKFRFPTFLGASKFYNQYALKTTDGKRYYERFEDRVVLTALAFADDEAHAKDIVTEIIEGRFQPATPTFLNAGRSSGGAPVSCFLLRIEDNMESISRSITDSLQLSKRGGGVGLLLTNIREAGAPIKKMENQSSGVIPVMKMLEDGFSYANQLGQRDGAGVVYLNAHHPDIMSFLDTKRENADEKIRIKTLSLGVVIPDITFELAKNNEDMYLFSPYDVERVYGKPFADISVTDMYHEMVDNPEIRKKKINARKFFQTLAEIQFESGYPYIMFDDTVNAANVAPNIGRITHSNLCSEIAQPFVASTYWNDGSFKDVGMDVSCNLGSFNIAKMNKLTDPSDFYRSVRTAYRFLTNVSGEADIDCSPSVQAGNRRSHAIGLGQMNLHGALIEMGIPYDSEEARLFFDTYMAEITYAIINYSMDKATETKEVFEGFEGSRWEDGSVISSIQKHFNRYSPEERAKFSRLNLTHRRWEELQRLVSKFGLYNRNLQAIPPTGSISYINNSTSSIHPVTSLIEIRKEGKTGRVYYPAYGLTNENKDKIKTAYEIGPEPIIDMYAVSTPYIDQAQSLTLFFKDTATTRDLNRAQIYAHKKGIKTLYYVRLNQKALAGTEVDGCVSCML